LDGNFVGNTPSTIGVSQGDHTITVKKNGYKLWEKKIKVTSGNVKISAELEPGNNEISAGATETTKPGESNQQTEAVSFASDPNGAEVYVDNSLVGKTPITLSLGSGHHYVRMFAKDYKNWSQQITVGGESELKVAAKLEKSE
jgi:hypothetical protein